MVTKFERPARLQPDAQATVDELTARQVQFLSGSIGRLQGKQPHRNPPQERSHGYLPRPLIKVSRPTSRSGNSWPSG